MGINKRWTNLSIIFGIEEKDENFKHAGYVTAETMTFSELLKNKPFETAGYFLVFADFLLFFSFNRSWHEGSNNFPTPTGMRKKCPGYPRCWDLSTSHPRKARLTRRRTKFSNTMCAVCHGRVELFEEQRGNWTSCILRLCQTWWRDELIFAMLDCLRTAA